jgi:carbon catabolite-derepressing protein kinase
MSAPAVNTTAAPASPGTPQADKKKVYIGNYKVGKTLGEGSFAKVKLAVHSMTGQKVTFIDYR